MLHQSKILKFACVSILGISTLAFNVLAAPGARAAANLQELNDAMGMEFRNFVTQGLEEGRRVPASTYTNVFKDKFGRFLNPTNRENLEDAELRVLYAAADSVAFYTQDRGIAKLLVELSDEIAARADGGDNMHLQETYEELLEARLFEEAAAFAERHHGSLEPQALRVESAADDFSGPSILEVAASQNGSTLIRKPARISEGEHIVVVSHPYCSFSRAAAEYFESHEQWARRFEGKTFWVQNQGSTVPVAKTLDWNKEFDSVDMVISYQDAEWPEEILFTNTPMFYFLRDGEVVHHVMGWLGEETLQELEAGFRILEEN